MANIYSHSTQEARARLEFKVSLGCVLKENTSKPKQL